MRGTLCDVLMHLLLMWKPSVAAIIALFYRWGNLAERVHTTCPSHTCCVVVKWDVISFCLCFSVCHSFLHWASGHGIFFLVPLSLKKVAGNQHEENRPGHVLWGSTVWGGGGAVWNDFCWGLALSNIDSCSKKAILSSMCLIESRKVSVWPFSSLVSVLACGLPGI